MPDVLQSLSSEAARPGSTTVIDCAAYCGGVRVADVGIEQIRGALERADQVRLARAVRTGKGHPAGRAAAVRTARPRHRGRLQRPSAAETRVVRGLALRRAADGAPGSVAPPPGVRRDAHLPRARTTSSPFGTARCVRTSASGSDASRRRSCWPRDLDTCSTH